MGRNQRARQVAARHARRMRIAVAAVVTAVVVAVAAVVAFQLAGTEHAQASGSNSADSTDSSIGRSFPDFDLPTLDAGRINKASLNGTRTLVWFTDAACAPCQVGAVKVRQLNDELADRAIRVVTVFVNPAEPKSALAAWREKFGDERWDVALDSAGELSTSVDLRYLDTKFLLDAQGKIVDVDSAPVDDAYLDLLRRQAAN